MEPRTNIIELIILDDLCLTILTSEKELTYRLGPA